MTDDEMEVTVSEICQAEIERLRDDELDDHPEYQIEVRPPASAKQIAECEDYLGRLFPPSYRHFLSLHNGLELGPDWFLLGTEDYLSEKLKEHLTWWNRSFLDTDAHPPFPNLPDEEFFPQNFYRLVDAKGTVAQHLQPLKTFIDSHKERKTWDGPYELDDYDFCLPRHTMLSLQDGNDCYKFFDIDTLSSDGEMNVVSYCCDGGPQSRYQNVYAFLQGVRL